MTGRWFVTPHAVRQYVQRYAYQLSYDQALANLIRLSEGARFIRRSHGCELWRGPRPSRLRMIVGPGDGEKPALVTVL